MCVCVCIINYSQWDYTISDAILTKKIYDERQFSEQCLHLLHTHTHIFTVRCLFLYLCTRIFMCFFFFLLTIPSVGFSHSSVFTVVMFIRPFYQHFIADATGCYRYYFAYTNNFSWFFPSHFFSFITHNFVNLFSLIFFNCVNDNAWFVVSGHKTFIISETFFRTHSDCIDSSESRYCFGTLFKCTISGWQ